MNHELTRATNDLLAHLTKPDGYPMTPENAAREIVNTMLFDLSDERRAAIGGVIEEWATKWGALCSSTASESTYR